MSEMSELQPQLKQQGSPAKENPLPSKIKSRSHPASDPHDTLKEIANFTEEASRAEIEADPEIENGKKVLADVIDTLNNWGQSLPEGELIDDSDNTVLCINEARQRYKEADSKLYLIATPRHEWNESGYGLKGAIEKAQLNLKDKKDLLKAYQDVKALDAQITSKSLEFCGAQDIEELKARAESGRGYGNNIFNKPRPEDIDILWSVIEPYVKQKFGDNPNLGRDNFDNIHTTWTEATLGDTDEIRLNILDEVARKAKEAGNTRLLEVAQAEIASHLLAAIEHLPSHDQIEENRKLLDTKGRGELVRSAANVALSLDRVDSSSDYVEDTARQLGCDGAELGYVFGTDYAKGPEFFQRLAEGRLQVSSTDQPVYLRELLGEYFDDRWSSGVQSVLRSCDGLNAPPNQIFLGIASRLSKDPVVVEKAGKRIRQYEVAGKSKHMLEELKKGNYNFQRLISGIAEKANAEQLIGKFDRIIENNDEFGLCWEYFRMNADEQRRRFFNMTSRGWLPTIKMFVPGIPERLQWGTMSQRDKDRINNDIDFDAAEELPVDSLTEVGEALITKAVLKEVLKRSADVEEKGKSDERNRKLSESGRADLQAGDLLHGTDVKHLQAVLHGGARAGEFLGFDEKGDMTPLGADFSQVPQTDVDGTFQYAEKTPLDADSLRQYYAENPFKGIYYASIAAQYGARDEGKFASMDAKSASDSGVSLIFNRQGEDAFLKGTEYRGHMREHHTLVFVGLPSTEISGLIVNGAAADTIQKTKNEVVAHGFYIPVYNLDGNLIFAPEQYDQMKIGNNTVAEQLAA